MTKVYIGCGAGFAGDRFDAAVPVVATLAQSAGRAVSDLRGARRAHPGDRAEAAARRSRPGVLAVSRHLPAARAGRLPSARHPHRHQHGRGQPTRRRAARACAGARARHPGTQGRGRDGRRSAGDDVRSGSPSASDHRGHRARRSPDRRRQCLSRRPAGRGCARHRCSCRSGRPDHGCRAVARARCSTCTAGERTSSTGWRKARVCGHLLECGAQVTGAYFPDPGFKDVPDLANVGFPIAEVEADGDLVVTKAANTGGLVSRATVIEQILYEVHDPHNYLTPDVVLDLGDVTVEEIGINRVRVQGARGKPPPATLKATVCVDAGWLGEGEISYAGPNALGACGACGLSRACPLPYDRHHRPCARGGARDAGHLRRQHATAPRPSRAAADGEYRVRAAVRSASSQRSHSRSPMKS